MFYVFHGEDDYLLRQAVNSMKAKLGDPSTADLNTTVLDGRSLSLDELRNTCDTMPFLAEQRLVIVEGLGVRLEPRSGPSEEAGAKGRSDPIESGLRDYLPHLPESARLVFSDRAVLSARNPLLRLAKELNGFVRQFSAPTGADLTHWIERRAQEAGGSISPRAAETLAAFVGGNLRQLAQEIEKLVTYAGQHTVDEAAVRLLVPGTREVHVWTMTDALAARQRDRSLRVLHELLASGEQPPVLLAIITRQFRTLIQVKEMGEQGMASDAIATELRLHPYVAKKAAEVARNFSFDRLQAIYRRLLETDLATKTGRLEPALALDMLVMDITSNS